MSHLYPFVLLVLLIGAAIAAPIPSHPDVKAILAGLSDPSEKVRDQSVAALRNRPDALPWLRRAAGSTDKDTARRATNLVDAAARARQKAVPKAVEACIRDGSADLFIEWHHFWQPESKDELWPVGPRMGKAALGRFAKLPPEGGSCYLEQLITGHLAECKPWRYLDGPLAFDDIGGAWHVRTDRIDLLRHPPFFALASVAGPVYAHSLRNGYFFALGPVHASHLNAACVLCDGPALGTPDRDGEMRINTVDMQNSFLACRGDVCSGSEIRGSVLLVDGNIDLSRTSLFKDSIIRASGKVRVPVNAKLENCTIEERAKGATVPYKFFELADVGLSVTDDEEGLVVREAKPNTPFGNCGLAKGDLIRAIDDVPAGYSEPFRKAVRRALVRQGDCLLTVTRGDKTIDLPVFFPPPK